MDTLLAKVLFSKEVLKSVEQWLFALLIVCITFGYEFVIHQTTVSARLPIAALSQGRG